MSEHDRSEYQSFYRIAYDAEGRVRLQIHRALWAMLEAAVAVEDEEGRRYEVFVARQHDLVSVRIDHRGRSYLVVNDDLMELLRNREGRAADEGFLEWDLRTPDGADLAVAACPDEICNPCICSKE